MNEAERKRLSAAAAALGAIGGKKGGRSCSAKKVAAGRKNMAKARARLAELIEAGKKATENDRP